MEPRQRDSERPTTGAIRIGIIGCGAISGSHAKAIQALDGLELVAACNRSAARLEAFSDQYRVPRRYQDWRQLLDDAQVDAVVICLPHHLHGEVAIAAMQQGKSVLVEKPMALSAAEAEAMAQAADRNRVTLMVGQCLRWNPMNRAVRRMLAEGEIGRIIAVHRRRCYDGLPALAKVPWANQPEVAGGWLLYGYGSHEYDAVFWLLQARPIRVAAMGTRGQAVWNDYDEILGMMELDNGAIATVIQSLNSKDSAMDCTIIGTTGTLKLAGAKLFRDGKECEPPRTDSSPHRDQMAEYARCIRSGDEPEASGRNVCATTMKALEAVKASLAERRTIDLVPAVAHGERT